MHIGLRVGAAVAQNRHRVVAVGGIDQRVQHDTAGSHPGKGDLSDSAGP